MTLTRMGWNPRLADLFAPHRTRGLIPGRVAREDRSRYTIWTEEGDLDATISGAMRHSAETRSELPTVGDWVALDPPDPAVNRTSTVVHAVLPRTTRFSRKTSAGTTDEQVVAANVDTALLVCGLDADFNLRRLERYLVLASESGAEPVVVLNKADLCPDIDRQVALVESVAIGAPIHPVCALDGEPPVALMKYLTAGKTAVLLGSSGVGKSTLINSIVQGDLKTGEVRQSDGRGQHTTTWREMVRVPEGGLLIDTPGLREIQLWVDGDGSSGADAAFGEIEEFANECRFRDCQHDGEPGCGVQAALNDGSLEADRFHSYLHLKRELEHLSRKQDHRARKDEVRRWKNITKSVRNSDKRRLRDGQ